MLMIRIILGVALAAYETIAHSTSRNPLGRISELDNVQLKPQHINAHSRFEIQLDAYSRQLKFTLEPNQEILAHGPYIEHLDEDGRVMWAEPINRLDHKVYRGDTWRQNLDATWDRVGWARIYVHYDGEDPLFEGAFTVNHDSHHIVLSSKYRSTMHELDPAPADGPEHMVMFRDSDILSDAHMHQDLRRGLPASQRIGCEADMLEFNRDPAHPVYASMQEKPQWSIPVEGLFGKRQMDTGTGPGNAGGVNLVSSIGQTGGCPNTRKIALVGVAYDCTYAGTFNSTQSATANVIAQMSSASTLYESTFNITLGLANVTANDANCPASAPSSAPWNVPCSSNVNIQDRLNLFSAWRNTKVDNNSHWTLLTNCNSGSIIGLAWLGQACVVGSDSATRNSTTGATEVVSGANVVAKTGTEWQVIAHETGHTFGAVHDCTSSTCSDGTSTAQQCCPLSGSTCDAGQKFIMNPSTSEGITNFSPCSIGNICSAIGRNSVKTSCLTSNKGVVLSTGPVCGNGIVEAGEDCDCGGVAGCGGDACCDPTTCKFKSGAVCDDANDDCCQNCQLSPSSKVCRPSTGVCDPQETCTGSSALCPADVTTPDGTVCTGSGGQSGLTCASGVCTSRNLQCKTLMGSYTQGNDTYACDDMSCTLSCASPEFGANTCYGLQQNFLDGTLCGGGGKCSNGQCKGSTFTKEIVSWIGTHRNLVIGISVAVGLLVLFIIGSWILQCIRRRKTVKRISNTWAPNSPTAYNAPLQQNASQQPYYWYGPGQGEGPNQSQIPPRSQPQMRGMPPAYGQSSTNRYM